MEGALRTWLNSVGLGDYCSNFEEHGWDEMSILSEMTDNDIQTCINKAGHRAKFRKALRLIRHEQATAVTTNNALNPSNTLVKGYTTLSEECRGYIASTLSSCGYPLPLTLVAGQNKVQTETTSSARRPQCTVNLRASDKVETTSILREEEGNPGIITIPIENSYSDSECILNGDQGEISRKTKRDNEDSSTSAMGILEVVSNNFVDENSRISTTDRLYTGQPLAVITNIVQESSHLMCRDPMNLTIIEHSDHTTVAEAPAQMIGEVCGPSNPVSNLKDQMEMIAYSFEQKDHLFVETGVYQELELIVEETHWATLLGKPGDGKSATAAHLMLKYRDEGYEPLFISSPQDWKMLIASDTEAKQFIVLDDMFGTSFLDKTKVNEWLSLTENNMWRIVKERNGNLVVVCTSRRYIFTDVESALAKFACFGKSNVLDMTQKTNQLTGEEKLEIFNRYAEEHKIEIDKESLKKIPQLDPPHGFPHCVELFCTNAVLRQNGLTFFDNPAKCVQKEVSNIKDNEPFKFFVLLLMLLNKNRVNSSYIVQLISNPSKNETKLFRAAGLNVDTAYPHIVKAVDALTNTYIKQETDGSYTFSHDSLKENVAVVYLSVNPVHAAELLSFQEIMSYTHFENGENVQVEVNKSVLLPLPSDIFVEKVTEEILAGNIETACKCKAWNDQTFTSVWIRYITCESNKIPSCLLKVILKEIFCSKDKNCSAIDKSHSHLLGTLIKFHLKFAVVTMLENKILQEKLKSIPGWFGILQQVLRIACTDCGRFDTDIIRSIFNSQRGEDGLMMNGSLCLSDALKHSKTDVALMLLQETVINPHNDTAFGGYFHDLVNSDIMSNDFDKLCSALLDKGANINQRDKTQNISPLFRCVLKSNMQDTDLDRLVCLVSKGADIYATISNGGTNIVIFALDKLTSEQCLHVLPKLRELGANFSYVTYYKMNALHFLWKNPDSHCLELLNYLIDNGVDASQINEKGVVPLMFALQKDPGIDCIRKLLELSIPKHKNKSGEGYFHYLCQSKCQLDRFRAYCDALLESGEDINLKDNEGKSPVLLFCENAVERRSGYAETTQNLQYLLSVGVDFKDVDNRGRNILHYLFDKPVMRSRGYGCTCSMCIDYYGSWKISSEVDDTITSIYFFLTKAFDIDCFQLDERGVNPVMLAIQNRAEFTFIKDLLNRQIPLQYNKVNESYFHYLARSYASDKTFDSIKSELIKNNIPYDPCHLRLPHIVHGSGAG